MAPIIVNKEEKIKQIARAALTLFSQKGYHATSVNGIAKAAGIGKGTVYEYFGTKADIFVAAIREWSFQLTRQIYRKSEGIDDPVQRLYAIAETIRDLCDPEDLETMGLIYEVIQQALSKDGVLFTKRHLVKEMLIGFRQIVVDILLDGISKGIFHPEIARDAEKIAVNFLAFLDGVGLHSLISKDYFNLKEQTNFYLRDLLQIILKKPTVNPVSLEETKGSRGQPAITPLEI